MKKAMKITYLLIALSLVLSISGCESLSRETIIGQWHSGVVSVPVHKYIDVSQTPELKDLQIQYFLTFELDSKNHISLQANTFQNPENGLYPNVLNEIWTETNITIEGEYRYDKDNNILYFPMEKTGVKCAIDNNEMRLHITQDNGFVPIPEDEEYILLHRVKK